RRRHTRFSRDWSSDVCSSDLEQLNTNFTGTPRDGTGGLFFKNKLWLLGGWNQNYSPMTNNEIYSSTDGINWTFVGNAPWARRHKIGRASCRKGCRYEVFGGD